MCRRSGERSVEDVFRRAACPASIAVVIAGCGGSNQAKQSTSAAPSTAATTASPGSLIALGDSTASTANPPCRCTAFAALFARRIGSRLNDQAVTGTEARDLLKHLKTETFVRQLVGKADGIVIDMGINDLPWSRSDNPCSVESRSGAVQWAGVDPNCIRRVARQYETP